MLLRVTLLSGMPDAVIIENVCTITPPISSDPPGTGAVFVMSNGNRVVVKELWEAIVTKIEASE